MTINAPHEGSAKRRVLASAYACEPGRGSEPGIGWNWARQIALHHELTLITRRNNVDAIRKAALSEDLRIDVVGHDLPRAIMNLKKGGRGAMAYYYLWQKSLAKVASELCSASSFDVCHHLTFASGWIPSGLAQAGLPFVFGPVGQHPTIPDAFQKTGSRGRRTADRIRESARRSVPVIDSGVGKTWDAADVILSLGDTFGSRLPESVQDRVVPMLACGVDRNALFEPEVRSADERMEIVFCGRLVNLKGVHVAMEAFALAAPSMDAHLTFVGKGPERARLEQAAAAYGISDRVAFTGALSHAETLQAMRASHVFLFPSFEGAGMVIPEAMASGSTVVCLDYGGPGEMTRGGRGVAVPLEACASSTASALSGALIHLHDNEPTRLHLAEVGQEWARREATWESKGAALSSIYSRAIQRFESRNAVAAS